MEAGHQLKSLLQLQLASDSSAVIHLPYILQTLDASSFSVNPHLTKWSSRIVSLLHSKDAGGRWAGLCIAHKSSLISKNFMVESASSWLPVALPMLSRNEPVPTVKAATRLLVTIFTAALDMPEFQRQISTPNIAKFTNALSNAAGTHADVELKAYCLGTLAQLMPIYPNAHRASYSTLSSLTLGFLNGGHPCPTDDRILQAAARLYSTLHLTGGKVGAAGIWRKAVDETLAFGWNAYFALRTTFPNDARNMPLPNQEGQDPSVAIPLNLDRIRCCSIILQGLLSTLTTRPVQVSCGQLVKYCVALLSSTLDDQIDGFVDPTTRAMEVSVVPVLWKYGCDLVSAMMESIHQYLGPYLSRICTILTYHLEQTLPSHHRVFILKTLEAILKTHHFLDSPILPTRMIKAVLPSLTVILVDSPTNTQNAEPAGKSRKGKKRAKNYEGDEVFKVSRNIICPTAIEGKVLLSALEVTRYCMQNPNIAAPQLSLASRIILSIHFALSQISPSILSSDPVLFDEVVGKVQSICSDLACSSTAVLHRATPLIVGTTVREGSPKSQAAFDLLLHPRLPPLVRPLPSLQSMSLFCSEESQEEMDARNELKLDYISEEPIRPKPLEEDITMEEQPTVGTASRIAQETGPPSGPPLPPVVPSPASEPSATNNALLSQKQQHATTQKFELPIIPKVDVKEVQGSVEGPSDQERSDAAASSVVVYPQQTSDDEEDQEMPEIDMQSDSDDEDEE